MAHEEVPAAAADAGALGNLRPRPVVLDSIEIRDPKLRKRCLDLLAQFHEDGQHDRLDTVVNEATRILEDRLRSLSDAPATCVGADLAKHAFGPPSPCLIVSEVETRTGSSSPLVPRGVWFRSKQCPSPTSGDASTRAGSSNRWNGGLFDFGCRSGTTHENRQTLSPIIFRAALRKHFRS